MKKKYFSLLLVCIMSISLAAQKKDLGVIDFLNIAGLSSPQVSPNGEEMLYVLAKSDWKENKQVGHIWRINTDGSDDRQITFGSSSESNPTWSPDGSTICFLAQRHEDEGKQIYLMRADGGEGKRLTDHPVAVSSVSWSPDGDDLYFLASDTLSDAEKKAKKLYDDVYALDEDYQQKHLWRVAVDGGKLTKVTAGDYSIMNYDISDNGNKIAVHRGPNPLFDNYSDSEIWIMNSDGGNATRLTNNKIGESGVKISADGNYVLFTAFANEDFDFYYNDKLFVLPTNGVQNITLPLGGVDYEVVSAEWSKDGNSVYYTANMGAEIQLWQYDNGTKSATQLTKGNHSVGQWHYNRKNDRHYMSCNTISNPGDISILENGQFRQITHHYDYLKTEFNLPRQELISWKGEDGIMVEGLVYYPHNYQAGTRYPLVVQTHGGPASSDRYGLSRSFTRYNPVLTQQGYVVLQPNYRGSTGYGDDFLRDMVGGYFRQSHLDVMAGVDHLIDLGIADPDRLVKMGWSAGGHMTNKLVTFTDRFKAASSGAGAVNWMGMYAQSDVRTYRTPWFGGSPWQKDAPIEVYWNNSPLKDISKVKTPTLVIVGGSDPRVPLPQSVEMYRAIRSLGVPTHLYVAPREPHGWRELRHRLYKINVELEWFAKYALGKSYEWEEVD